MKRSVTIVGLVVLAALWIGAPLLNYCLMHGVAQTAALDHDGLAARACRDLDVASAVSDARIVERVFYVLHRESPRRTRARVIAALRAAVAGDGKGDLAALLALVLLEAERRGELDTSQREWSLPLLNSADRDRLALAYPMARIPAVTISEPSSASLESRWARDTLEIRGAELQGDTPRATDARERIAKRTEHVLGPARRSAYLGEALTLAGLAFGGAFARGRIALRTAERSQGIDLAPWDGIGAFVRASLTGEAVTGAFGMAWIVASMALVRDGHSVGEFQRMVLHVSSLAGSVAAFLCLRIVLARVTMPVTVRDVIGTPANVPAAIALAIVLFAALETSRVCGLAIDYWLPMTPEPFVAASATGSSWPLLAIDALAAVIVAPFMEEILFRGLLFGSLRSALGSSRAALLAGIAFSILHNRSIGVHVELVAMGVIFAFAYQRTGTLVPLMLAHALFNYWWSW